MSSLAIGLVLLSAVMHAGWNLLSRRQRQPALFLYRLSIVVAVVGLVPAVVSEWLARSMPAQAWMCVVGSGICCGVYYYGLSRAYGAADFSTAYPLVRAFPVLLLAVADVLLGRQPSPAGWMGLALVVSGCLLAPLQTFRDFSFARYWNHSSVWIALAAVGTFGYSILDKMAAEALRPGPASALRYEYFYFLISGAALAGLLHGFDRKLLREAEIGWLLPTAGAVLNFGGYALVLWAYQMTPRASYVLALRQFSIVIGVILAFALFREQGRLVRLAGTLLIVAGIVLVAVWGK